MKRIRADHTRRCGPPIRIRLERWFRGIQFRLSRPYQFYEMIAHRVIQSIHFAILGAQIRHHHQYVFQFFPFGIAVQVVVPSIFTQHRRVRKIRRNTIDRDMHFMFFHRVYPHVVDGGTHGPTTPRSSYLHNPLTKSSITCLVAPNGTFLGFSSGHHSVTTSFGTGRLPRANNVLNSPSGWAEITAYGLSSEVFPHFGHPLTSQNSSISDTERGSPSRSIRYPHSAHAIAYHIISVTPVPCRAVPTPTNMIPNRSPNVNRKYLDKVDGIQLTQVPP